MTNVTTDVLVRPLAHAAHDPAVPPDRTLQIADVRAAYASWTEAIACGDPEPVLRLYAHDAVLLATFATEPRATRQTVRDYFTQFTALPRLRAYTQKSLVQVFDDLAFHDGLYSFSYEKEAREVRVRARFSFAYRRRGDDWLIVRHHSSQVPAAMN